MTNHEIESLTEEALDAFWAVVAKHFPGATSGDLSVETTLELHRLAGAAVKEWVQLNVPDLS